MAPAFPLLADPARYSCCTIALDHDRKTLLEWVAIFEKSVPSMRDQAAASEGGGEEAQRRAARFAEQFMAAMQEVKSRPDAYGPPSIARFCEVREDFLRENGFADPYVEVKAKENDAALAVLPSVLAEHDAIASPEERLQAVLEGVFAGNVFDLGAQATIDLYKEGNADFRTTRAGLRRPFLIDGSKEFAARLAASPYRKALVFIDNAGSDVVLGMMPFTRELLRRGVRVCLAANSEPSLNDVTHDELGPLLERVAAVDAVMAGALREGRLTTVASGNRLPVIDLARVSEACAAEARDADLLVLEGMGRGVETNLRAAFTCDALHLAMVKHKEVAEFLGGHLYDVVCCFKPRPAPHA
eukprot:tig00021318_g20161.t1